MRSVVVTRPKQSADEFAVQLQQAGFEVVLAPLTEYVNINADFSDVATFDALIFTSAQGVRVFAVQSAVPEEMPVFAVGTATAQEAVRAGFKKVFTAEGDGQRLAGLIITRKSMLGLKRLLHVAGEDTVQGLAELLAAETIDVERRTVYKAKFLESVPDRAQRAFAEGRVDTVTFLSARTAQHFHALAKEFKWESLLMHMDAVCISDRVAAEVTGRGWRAVSTARHPNIESIVEAIRKLDEGLPQQAPMSVYPVLDAFGGVRPLATRLGISASTVQGWKERGMVPEARVKDVLQAAAEDRIPQERLWKEDVSGGSMTEDNSQQTKSGGSALGGGAPLFRKTDNGDRRGNPDRRQKRTAPDEKGNVYSDSYAGPERRTGADRRAYLSRQKERIRQEKWRFFNRTTISGGFLSACVLYAVYFLMAPEISTMNQNAERMKQMQTQLEEMNKHMLTLQEQQKKTHESVGMAINKRIESVEDTVDTVVPAAKAVVDAGTTMVTETARSGIKKLIDLLTMVQMMNTTPEGRTAVAGAIVRLKIVLANTRNDHKEMNERVAIAMKQDPALAKLFGKMDKKDLGAAAMLLAMNEMRGNIAGERPFGDDLAVLQKLAGNDPEMMKALNKLAPYAKNGVLSRETLQKEFKGLAADIVMAKLKGENLNTQDRILKRFEKYMKVRRIDQVEGDGVDAIVARAQLNLDKGDVHAAMEELRKLDGDPATAAKPWVDNAEGYVEADQSSDMMQAAVMQVLSNVNDGGSFSIDGITSTLKGALSGAMGGGGGVSIVSPGGGGGGSGATGPAPPSLGDGGEE